MNPPQQAAGHSLPMILRRKAGSLRFWLRVWLRIGSLPNALIIGAAKAGSTSLFDWLSQHPDVASSRIKETEYFDRKFGHGPHWYRAQFAPRRRHKVILEASPSYLGSRAAPERVRALLGTPKLIVLLRDPVDRAYSHHAMKVRHGLETLPFEEALEAEPERFGYIAGSHYAEQIEHWLSVFPRKNFLFIRAEDLFRDPRAQLARALRFLDLAPYAFPNLAAKNVGSCAPLTPELRARLDEHFAQPNRRLAELTGISWPPDQAAPSRP